nr:alpha-amylase family glycosyl hydrolase [Amycolatopsis antarctica]
MRRAVEEKRPAPEARDWWRDAVFYQVHLRSFADSDGDGIGDLEGLRSRLGYLELLGVDAVWLTPFYRSPMADNGYDVTDPRSVDPVFGDLDAFDAVLADAQETGIRVIVDVVPNHSGDLHPWFGEALAEGRGGAARERYVFRDGRGPDGARPPNDWQGEFGGPAWTRVPDGQWYLHLFSPRQPDLNWDNAEVQADFELTLRFWLDRGVDGVRVGTAHGLAKPAGLPDATDGTDPRFDEDGVHEIHRRIRKVLDGYPRTVAVGEIHVPDGARFARYLRPDELHLGVDSGLIRTEFDADALQAAVDESLATVAEVGAPATWTLGDHDTGRQVSRHGGGDRGRARARAMALVELALPGAVFLYNGEELGLDDVELPTESLTDPRVRLSGGTDRGRDGVRVPIPWEGTDPPFSFSTGETSWLPIPGRWAALTVEAQLEDTASTLSLYRQALELRQSHPAFTGDHVEWFGAPAGCFALRRHSGDEDEDGALICALNTSAAPISLPPGEVLLTSAPMVDGRLPPDAAAWLV